MDRMPTGLEIQQYLWTQLDLEAGQRHEGMIAQDWDDLWLWASLELYPSLFSYPQ